MGHHFESALARKYPKLDLTDIFAFQSDRLGFTAFVMCQNPQSTDKLDGSLMEGGLYSFHIGFDQSLSQGVTITFKPANSTLEMGIVSSAKSELGDFGASLGTIEQDKSLLLTNGIKAWSGIVKDPFAGNALGLRTFKAAAEKNLYQPEAFNNRQNFFEHLLSTAIVFEIPESMLAQKIYYTATSAWFDHGHWHQANRIGHVLLPHLYLHAEEDIEKQMSNGVDTDLDRRKAASDIIAKFTTLANSQSDPRSYADKIAQQLFPDVVPYQIGTQAKYAVEKINGRAIEDPAMDVALTWLVGTRLSAQVDAPVRSSKYFPYVLPLSNTKL